MRDFFIKDWGWKLFSLVLAIMIWLTVHRVLQDAGLPAGVADGDKPITYGNLPVDLVSPTIDVREFRLLQAFVTVTVSGPADVIGRLQANQIHPIISITDTASLHKEKQHVEVSVPAGVTVVSIKPDSIGVIAPPPEN